MSNPNKSDKSSQPTVTGKRTYDPMDVIWAVRVELSCSHVLLVDLMKDDYVYGKPHQCPACDSGYHRRVRRVMPQGTSRLDLELWCGHTIHHTRYPFFLKPLTAHVLANTDVYCADCAPPIDDVPEC